MKLIFGLLTLTVLSCSSSSFSQEWKNLYEDANTVYGQGNLDSALTLYKRSLVEIEKLNGKDTNYANSLYYVQEIHRKQGEFDTSIKEGLLCLEIYQKFLPNPHSHIALIQNQIALAYEFSGKAEKATHHHKKSRALYLQLYGKKSKAYAKSCQNLAGSYYNLGKYETALQLYSESKSIWDEHLNKNDYDYPELCNNFALLHETLGNYSIALELYKECRNINSKAFGKDFYGYSASCLNLGDFYYDLGEYESALNYYLEAKSTWEKYQDLTRYEYFAICNNLAGLYRDLGDYNKAIPLYNKGIQMIQEILGEEHPYYSGLMLNLAILYSYQDEYDKAIELINEVRSIQKRTIGVEHPNYAQNSYTLGSILSKTGMLEKAKTLHEEAYQIRKKALGNLHPDVASSMLKLGQVYMDLGEIEKGGDMLVAAHDIVASKLGEDHPKTASSLMVLSNFYRSQNMPNKAADFGIQSISRIKKNMWKNFAFLSEKEKSEYLTTIEPEFDQYFTLAFQYKDLIPEGIEQAFELAIFRKGIVLRTSSQTRIAILNSGNKNLIKTYDKWIRLKKKITSLLAFPLEDQKNLLELEEEANKMEQELVKGSGVFAELQSENIKSWKEIQKNLKPKEIVVEFIHFRESNDSVRYCAFLLDAKMKQPKMIHLFWETELESILDEVKGSDSERIKKIYQPNGRVYNLVWKPIEKQCKKYKKIYYAPTGLLHRVSFAALSRKQDVYLCDQFDMDLKSVGNSIHEESFITGEGVATLFGGVDYNVGAIQDEIWSFLPGTKVETEKINQLLIDKGYKVNYLTSKNATENKFKELAKTSKVLHLSTHGFFYPDPEEMRKKLKMEYIDHIEFRGSSKGGKRGIGSTVFLKNKNPLMRSGLTFAGANKVWNEDGNEDEEDGVLTAKEVSNMNLMQTDMVVLSACETGLGDIQGSEGVYGLQRAFKIAGVNYIIMSLWQVPDKETAEFMEVFYKNLLEGQSIRGAFRITQELMRSKYDPYFWAAFVLVE